MCVASLHVATALWWKNSLRWRSFRYIECLVGQDHQMPGRFAVEKVWKYCLCFGPGSRRREWHWFKTESKANHSPIALPLQPRQWRWDDPTSITTHWTWWDPGFRRHWRGGMARWVGTQNLEISKDCWSTNELSANANKIRSTLVARHTAAMKRFKRSIVSDRNCHGQLPNFVGHRWIKAHFQCFFYEVTVEL